MGMPVPSGIFETVRTALTDAALIVTALQMLGPGVTMAELSTSFSVVVSGAGSAAVATALAEIAVVAGACVAAFYIGAVIGSILYAAWRSNQAEMGMVLTWARQQCERLGMRLLDLARRVMDALDLGWDNLMELLT